MVSSATSGTWYALLYTDSVPSPSNYTIVATSGNIFLTGSTPSSSGTSAITVLTLTGAGFDQTTSVALVGEGDISLTATSTSIDLPTQITATVAAGSIPSGVYSIEVNKPGLQPAILANALTIVQGGQAILQTSVIVPNPIGYHIPSTLYVKYSNVGNIPMAAPLLVLDAYQGSYIWRDYSDFTGETGEAYVDFGNYTEAYNYYIELGLYTRNYIASQTPPTLLDETSHMALMTLDASLANQGYWTAATPAGFSHQIEILASGATPGVLEPGESVTVPVYYDGWQQPWNFSYPPINFVLGAVLAGGQSTPVGTSGT